MVLFKIKGTENLTSELEIEDPTLADFVDILTCYWEFITSASRSAKRLQQLFTEMSESVQYEILCINQLFITFLTELTHLSDQKIRYILSLGCVVTSQILQDPLNVTKIDHLNEANTIGDFLLNLHPFTQDGDDALTPTETKEIRDKIGIYWQNYMPTLSKN